jgi:hypothetical protein
LCIHVHIHVQFHIRPHIHLHVNFCTLRVVVTFIKMAPMVMLYNVRWLCPLSAFVIVVPLSRFCDGFIYLSLFGIYFPFALFSEETRSNPGLCDCGGGSFLRSKRIMHKQIAQYFDFNSRLKLGVRESPAQTHELNNLDNFEFRK